MSRSPDASARAGNADGARPISQQAKSAKQEADFQLLLQIVLSDQLTHDQVAQLLRDHPDFARWYEAQKA